MSDDFWTRVRARLTGETEPDGTATCEYEIMSECKCDVKNFIVQKMCRHCYVDEFIRDGEGPEFYFRDHMDGKKEKDFEVYVKDTSYDSPETGKDYYSELEFKQDVTTEIKD